jgi:hypothetical protein
VTSQHGAYALRAGLTRLYARMRMHTFTRPGNHTHAQACTHRPICNTYCNNGFVNAPQCYVIPTLPVLFVTESLRLTSK